MFNIAEVLPAAKVLRNRVRKPIEGDMVWRHQLWLEIGGRMHKVETSGETTEAMMRATDQGLRNLADRLAEAAE